MRKIGCKTNMRFTVFFFIFFLVIPFALAEDQPKYNFATTTASSTILIQPGETIKVPAIYFYNIYGNRITHVSLYLKDYPPGWKVKFEPEMHDIQVNISGTITTTSENFYVMPSQPVTDVPVQVPENMVYMKLGGVEGNILANVAYLNITVPPDTPLGGTYKITARAVGSWFGQAATLAFSQERSFDFTVQTITHKFSEEIVVPTPEAEKKETNYLLYLVAFIALAALVLGFYVGRKKK
jgi:hypothetical protein